MRYNSAVNTARSSNSLEVHKRILESRVTPKTLFAFGLNHRTAPVEVREKLYLSESEIPSFLDKVAGELPECLVLSTCNRTEFYAVSDSLHVDPDRYKQQLIDFKQAHGAVEESHFFTLISCSACEQLFKVATSIDSKIVGDSQILRQLRGAYQLAQENGRTGKILNQLVQRAFKLGKQTYTETSIHDGAVSASLAAVELAIRTFGSLHGRTVMVLGAGETARFTAEALANKRVGKIIVSNRTRSNAEELLASLQNDFSFESEIVDFECFKRRLSDVDIVISSTGSDDPILYKDDFEGQTRKILLIDIAVPRDIDDTVAENPNVVLKNIDDLNSIVDENHERRSQDLPNVRRMIVKEMVDFLSWYYTLPLLPSYEKTGIKPSAEQTAEVLKIKQFLSDNVSEIHRLYAKANGNFREDLDRHFDLIDRLQTMKARTISAAV
jgi:glutamyl-tRNA reductase